LEFLGHLLAGLPLTGLSLTGLTFLTGLTLTRLALARLALFAWLALFTGLTFLAGLALFAGLALLPGLPLFAGLALLWRGFRRWIRLTRLLRHGFADALLGLGDGLGEVGVGLRLGVLRLAERLLEVFDLLVEGVLGLFEVGDSLFLVRPGGGGVALLEVALGGLHFALGLVEGLGGFGGGGGEIGGDFLRC
jgi:hypothetical protein